MPPVSQRWAQSVLWCMCQASQDVRPAGSGLCPAWKICLIYMFYFQLLFGCIFAKIKHQEVLTMRLYVRCAWANCICTKGLKKKRQAGKDNKQTLDSVGEALRIWRWSKKEVVVNYLNSARLLKSTEVRAQSTIQGKSTPGVLCLSLGIFFFFWHCRWSNVGSHQHKPQILSLPLPLMRLKPKAKMKLFIFHSERKKNTLKKWGWVYL